MNYGQCSIPAGLSGVVSIAAGWLHGLALLSNGSLVMWGSYIYTSGSGNCTLLGPVFLPNTTQRIVAVAGGCGHSLALTSTGQVLVWGSDNSFGQLTLPSSLSGGASPAATAISTTANNNIVLLQNGSVVVWGRSSEGQLSVPTTAMSGISMVASGWAQYVVYSASNGTVRAWGRNIDGECNPPAGLTQVTALAGNWGYSYALLSNGTIVTWGNNYGGQQNVPQNMTGVVAIAAGEGHLAAMYGCTVSQVALPPPSVNSTPPPSPSPRPPPSRESQPRVRWL